MAKKVEQLGENKILIGTKIELALLKRIMQQIQKLQEC